MKLLHVNTADVEGGAERAALDLHRQLLARGIRSTMAVGRRRLQDDSIWELPNDRFRNSWARAWLRATEGVQPASSGVGRYLAGLRWGGQPTRWLSIHRGREDMEFPASRRLLDLAPFSPSLVHLHNLHGGYFDLRVLPDLTARVPVVATLHDAWLLSGHCAQSFDCERWRHGCGACPDLTIYPGVLRDATDVNWQRKKAIFDRSQLCVSTASRWMMGKVEASMVWPSVVSARVIPYGIDLEVFSPGDRDVARDNLRLPRKSRILLFVGNAVTSNQFKDFRTLAKALSLLSSPRDQSTLLVCLGESRPSMRIGPVEVRFDGRLTDSSAIADYYRACDVYVHPARAEAFGLSVTEAQACARPVVATATGGIVEQVLDTSDTGPSRGTGILVPPEEPGSLAAALEHLLGNESLRVQLGENAVRHAQKFFGMDRYVSDHLEWYSEILSTGAVTARRTR